MTNFSFFSFQKRILIGALLLAGAFQGVKAQQPWYVGVQGGTSFGQCTLRSITEHQIHWGAQGGLFGGYRMSRLFSLEAGLQYGAQSQYALDCCPYWLSESLERTFAPVSGQTGWYYRDIESRTRWGKLALQANFDLLSLITKPESRWSLNVSPELSVVTTGNKLITPDKEIEYDRQWHAGLGGETSVGFRITDAIGIALYGDITCLTGKRFDNIPEHAHKSNLIWDTGLKLSLNLGKSKTQKPEPKETAPAVTPAASTTAVDDAQAARLEAERAERERLAAQEAERAERERLAREEAERLAAAQAAADKERAFNTPIPTVYFANNSSSIDEPYIPLLEMALSILERYPDFKLEIHAYCSNTGTKEYNDKLSEKRMEAVRQWFASRGIGKERMGQAYYHGIDYNASTDDAARRAELKFVK
ncbi:MAG: OmpA family protein [Bacteroidaceae bacterium]|nr:OmpA family protein [Bacteroidaceae bacterium]